MTASRKRLGMLGASFTLGFGDQGPYVERGTILETLTWFELDASPIKEK
jgi:hypothetical protein